MKDQVHIRNAEAAHLARTLARQSRKTITEVILEALRQYRPDPHGSGSRGRVDHWRRLLREDRKRRISQVETPVEALYDETTGLPK
jgi:hypothetical protein